MKYKFARFFQNCLERHGYTQKMAAEALHVTPQTINAYIQGRSIPSADIFLSMVDAFDISALDFFYEFTEMEKISGDEVLEITESLSHHQSILLKGILLYFKHVNVDDFNKPMK